MLNILKRKVVIIILIENQYIKLKWHNSYKKYYESKGYVFTGDRTEFTVKAEDLSPSSKCKIKVRCDYCNEIYETTYFLYNKGISIFPKSCCPRCTGKKSSEVSLKRRANTQFKQAQLICDKMHYELLSTSEEYHDSSTEIKFICPRHGVQSMAIGNLLSGHRCFWCGRDATRMKIRKDVEIVKRDIESVHNNQWLNPDEYVSAHTKNLKIKCGLCGNIFITSYQNYTRGNVNTCRSCTCRSYSSGEGIISNFLLRHHIEFESEKRFDDCRDQKPLPFDFYLPSYNLCIEFDGQQHFSPIFGDSSFYKTVLHDGMKNNYCRWNGIRLVRIPYIDGHNIEFILDNLLFTNNSAYEDIVSSHMKV